MCGIVGTAGYVPPPNAREAALQRLSHRGPDGANQFCTSNVWLGHTLLAITAPPAEAHQPMTSRDGGVHIVFNGEVFNAPELHDQCCRAGYGFDGASDTEVLLAAYLVLGEAVFTAIDGIYALAIHDQRGDTPRLWLARDAAGVKPLFVASLEGGGVAFASELGSLCTILPKPPGLSTMSLAMLLSAGSVPQPQTIFEGVASLPPGAVRQWRLDLTPLPVDTPSRSGFFWPSPREPRNSLRPALSIAVERQTSDVGEVHLYLGGGVDSALLGAIAGSNGKTVVAHTLSLNGRSIALDETLAAKALADHMGWRHQIHAIEDNQLASRFVAFIDRMDFPTVDGLNNALISAACSGQTRVTFSGTGPDEMLFGYPWMADMLALRQGQRPDTAMLAADWISRCTVFSDAEVAALVGTTSSLVSACRLEGVVRADPGPQVPLSDRIRHICLNRFTLDRLLRDIDVTGMAQGLEVRVPFLDRAVVEACWAQGAGDMIPMPDKAYGGCKRPLVEVASTMLPSAFFVGNTKRGFILPFDAWLRGPLREQFAAAFGGSCAPIDTPTARRYWTRFQSGEPLALQVWLLGIAIMWLQRSPSGENGDDTAQP